MLQVSGPRRFFFLGQEYELKECHDAPERNVAWLLLGTMFPIFAYCGLVVGIQALLLIVLWLKSEHLTAKI